MASTPALLNLALAHHRDGDLGAAQTLYQQVLAADPAQADALHLSGMLLHQQGRSAQGQALIERAVALAPGVAVYHANLGLVLQALGQVDAAHQSLLRAIDLDPLSPDAYQHLGVLLTASGQPAEAVGWLQQALARQPDLAEAHAQLGHVWVALGRHALARDSFERVCRLRPQQAEAHNNLACALAAMGQPEQALVCLRHALALKPDFAIAMSNLAGNLTGAGQAREALGWARQAVAADPALDAAWKHLGQALQHSGAVAEAQIAFDRCLALNGADASHRLNRALCLLLQGDYAQGWAEYESRLAMADYRPLAAPPRCPVWQGEALAGRSLRVMAEQGLGDTLQFVRYVPMLQAAGARVVLQCQAPLLRLLQGLPGADQVVDVEAQAPDTDFAVSLMSLPHRLGTTLADVPARLPCLQPPLAEVLHWRRVLADLQDGPRIGLAWQGSREHPADAYRSMPLTTLDALADLPGLHFVSLQRERPAEPAGRLAARLVDRTAGLRDMADLAGLIANLDLVISVDTSVCHLAGSMARPVWVLLHAGPDFRWLMGREDSPWYPTARLFRQRQLGDWPELVARLAQALAGLWRQPPGPGPAGH